MVLAFITVLAVIVVRLILFYTGHPPEGTDFLIVHFLAVATVVFFTDHQLLSQDNATRFPDLMRSGFKSAAVYALVYSAFIWIYYATVEPHYFTHRVDELVHKGLLEGQPENIIRPRLTQFFTPFNYTTITFFALLLAGVFNAVVIGIVHHKVLRRVRR